MPPSDLADINTEINIQQAFIWRREYWQSYSFDSCSKSFSSLFYRESTDAAKLPR